MAQIYEQYWSYITLFYYYQNVNAPAVKPAHFYEER